MTRGAFRNLTLQLLKYSGQPYLDDTADINSVINNRLKKFTELTRCLYDDAITFTLAASSAIYSLRDTSVFSREVSEVQYVLIDGAPLYNLQAVRGPVSIDELMTVYPGYQTAACAKPFHYALRQPSSIRLFPAPDQVYSNCFVAGWYLHPNISTTAGSGDAVELSIPEEYVRTAAVFTAVELLIPTADGQTDYDRMAMLAKGAAEDMQLLRDRSAQKLQGPFIRGWKRGTRGGFLGTH